MHPRKSNAGVILGGSVLALQKLLPECVPLIPRHEQEAHPVASFKGICQGQVLNYEEQVLLLKMSALEW